MIINKILIIDLFAEPCGLGEGFIRCNCEPIAEGGMKKDACDTLKKELLFIL